MSKDYISISELLEYRDAFNVCFSGRIHAYKADLQQLEQQYNRKAWQPFFRGIVENLSCSFPAEELRRTADRNRAELSSLLARFEKSQASQRR